jgi:hypothetical protein
MYDTIGAKEEEGRDVKHKDVKGAMKKGNTTNNTEAS